MPVIALIVFREYNYAMNLLPPHLHRRSQERLPHPSVGACRRAVFPQGMESVPQIEAPVDALSAQGTVNAKKNVQRMEGILDSWLTRSTGIGVLMA